MTSVAEHPVVAMFSISAFVIGPAINGGEASGTSTPTKPAPGAPPAGSAPGRRPAGSELSQAPAISSAMASGSSSGSRWSP
jgi:hypothetical protein